MSSFVKNGFDEFCDQLETFNTALPTYKDLFGLSDEVMASTAADSAFLTYSQRSQRAVASYAKNVTSFRDSVRYGNANEVITHITAAPDLGVAPAMVAPNVQLRFSNLGQTLKKHPKYTDAIGQALDIVAVADTFDPSTGKPTFTLSLGNGGYPQVKWLKSGFSGVEIWKNTGAGFVLLDKVSKPTFIDKSSLPAVGTSAVWIYRMIYLYKDERVGTWSDDVSMTVMGSL